jgi:hypothetical protein
MLQHSAGNNFAGPIFDPVCDSGAGTGESPAFLRRSRLSHPAAEFEASTPVRAISSQLWKIFDIPPTHQ